MKIAIVTGASSGMGREFLLTIDKTDTYDEIWAIARRKNALEELSAQTHIPVRPMVLDLGKEDSFRIVVKSGIKKQLYIQFFSC